jgi:RNAse (barnase) inhibitor barstar
MMKTVTRTDFGTVSVFGATIDAFWDCLSTENLVSETIDLNMFQRLLFNSLYLREVLK